MDYRDQLRNVGKAIEPERWKPTLVFIAALVVVGFLLYRGMRTEARRQEVVREARPHPIERALPEAEPCPPENAQGALVSGRLLYDGRPLLESTRARPYFWFRNEETDREAKEVASCWGKEGYAFWDFAAPGRYLVSIGVNAEAGNGGAFPGDYHVSHVFTVPVPPDKGTDIDLLKVIHLTAPQDNAAGIEGWDAPCEGKPAFKSPVTFSWEPLGAGVAYRYAVDRGEERATRGSSAILPLDSGCHGFRLFAWRKGRRIGQLLTHGPKGGLGWSYSFRVE